MNRAWRLPGLVAGMRRRAGVVRVLCRLFFHDFSVGRAQPPGRSAPGLLAEVFGAELEDQTFRRGQDISLPHVLTRTAAALIPI